MLLIFLQEMCFAHRDRGEMLPIFTQEFFPAQRLRMLGSKQGENAVHFLKMFLHIDLAFPVQNMGKCCPVFSKNVWGLMYFLVQNRRKCCPFFLQEMFDSGCKWTSDFIDSKQGKMLAVWLKTREMPVFPPRDVFDASRLAAFCSEQMEMLFIILQDFFCRTSINGGGPDNLIVTNFARNKDRNFWGDPICSIFQVLKFWRSCKFDFKTDVWANILTNILKIKY